MQLPKNSRKAAELVKKMAKCQGKSLSAYCISKGVHPSVVYNWTVRNGLYDKNFLARLVDAPKNSLQAVET